MRMPGVDRLHRRAASHSGRRRRGLSATGRIALAALTVVVIAVVVGPEVWEVHPEKTDLTNRFAGPISNAPLGTDEFGRDILSRLLNGGRLSLLGAVLVLVGATTLGIVIGGCAGTLGRRTDSILGRLIDGGLALPDLVIAFAIVGVMGRSFWNVLLALVLTTWPWYARVYRGLFLRESRQMYVLAAQAVGASPQRVLWVHTAPNILGPAIVLMTTNLGAAILSLTALSFLGLGVQPPQAEWGAMINGSRSHFQSHLWVMVAPGLAISISVLAVSILGDALRDFFDPRRVGHWKEDK